MLFEVNPLRQNNAERVVDPPDSVCGLTIRNDVAHYRFYRLEQFDIPAASRLPQPACASACFTLYERFSNNDGLLSLLRRRARLNLFSAIKSSRRPEQVCRGVLNFFAARPNDFRLISEDWAIAFARKEHMPSFEFLKQSLAKQIGGQPDRHTPVALALVALLHGTATLLHSVEVHMRISKDFRHACISACEALIQA